MRPAPVPQGRVAGRLRAHSLTCIPFAFWRPLFRAWQGLGRQRHVWRGCARVGAAERKSEGGRRRGRAHTPYPWHHPLLCGRAPPPGAAALSCRGVGDRAGFSGVQKKPMRDQRGKSSFLPSEAEKVLTRKWLCEGDKSGELAIGSRKPLCCSRGGMEG